VSVGVIANFTYSIRKQVDQFGFEYDAYIKIPMDGVYYFYTISDDGSQLFIDDKLIVDNDKLHGSIEKEGVASLAEGFHSIKVKFFDKTGGDDLKVSIKGSGLPKQQIPDNILFVKK